jgi:hypothetical protein
MRLTWVSVFSSEPEDPIIHVSYEDGDQYYPSTCCHDWALHQWWEDESGNGEWRKIETIEMP